MAEQEGTAPRPLSLQESESAFIDFIKEKRKVTLEEALTFEDMDKGIWFGPDTDALSLLDKYIWLGFVRHNQKSGEFELTDSKTWKHPALTILEGVFKSK